MHVISQRITGTPDVLELTDIPRPTPSAGEVLVRVHAAGVNPVDAKVRSGAAPLLGTPPFTVGWDLSGTVEELGAGVESLRIGDEVYGMAAFPKAANAYAEFAVVAADELIAKPSTIDHAQAAALPLAALTAWQGLVDGADLRPGQRVLIHAGGGGVGHLAIQIAKARGAHVITTASGTKAEFVRGLGADEVIDRHTTDFTTAVRDVDVVLEVLGGDNAERSISVVRPGGFFVTIVGRGDTALEGRVTAAGLRFVAVGVHPDRAALEGIDALVRAGKLRPHVDQVLPLAEATKAHELIESGHTTGKIVLNVA